MEKIIYTPPPDKSVTVRALVLSALSDGKIEIKNPLISDDTLYTVKALKKLGAEIKIKKNRILIKGFGKYGAKKSEINVGESALLLRLLIAVLLNQNHSYRISGIKTILRRSFKDTIDVFKKMGAIINHNNYHLPVKIYPSKLKPVKIKVKSAQTKSAVLISSLYTSRAEIKDFLKTRDHTENLMKYLGIKIIKKEDTIYSLGGDIKSKKIQIINDISQSAVFITISMLLKKEIIIKNCGLNPLRTGFLKSIKNMGAKIEFKNIKEICNEKTGDIKIKPPRIIKAVEIKNISDQIDEIMLLALISSKAKGITKIHNVDLLKNKESNRLKEICCILRKLGSVCKIKNNTLIIKGQSDLNFKKIDLIDTKNDHRIAMLAGVIKKVINPDIKIINPECVKKTYPSFWADLDRII